MSEISIHSRYFLTLSFTLLLTCSTAVDRALAPVLARRRPPAALETIAVESVAQKMLKLALPVRRPRKRSRRVGACAVRVRRIRIKIDQIRTGSGRFTC